MKTETKKNILSTAFLAVAIGAFGGTALFLDGAIRQGDAKARQAAVDTAHAAGLHDITLGDIDARSGCAARERAVEFSAKAASGEEKRGVACVMPNGFRPGTLYYPATNPPLKPSGKIVP